MKKLTGALVLSFSLLLAAGCRSAGETKGGEDASTPASEGAVDASTGALTGGSGGTDTTQPTPGGTKSGSGTGTSAGTDPATPTGKGTGEGGTATALSEEVRAAQEACLDKWLNGKKMDRFGHPEGTMYAGGSPTFNEQTGEMTERLDYVYKRHPEAKKACENAGANKPAPAPTK
jgi:hypothetical protein